MNETLKTILERRSCRSYLETQINEDELQLILKAGMYAPSAMNQQPWHFTVIQGKELLSKVNEVIRDLLLKSNNKFAVERAQRPDYSAFYNAPTLIIVSGDEKAVAPEADCSLALGNMFLAAHSLRVGSCWINGVKRLDHSKEGRALIRELNIPPGHVIIGSGAFGYSGSEDQPIAPERKENVVTYIR